MSEVGSGALDDLVLLGEFVPATLGVLSDLPLVVAQPPRSDEPVFTW